MASSLMRDISYLEVGLRNAYDRCLLLAPSPDWVIDPDNTLFVTASRPGRTENLAKLDAMEQSLRELLGSARGHINAPGRGRIVAELMFAFWSKLSSKHLTASIWSPYLRHASPAGTSRSDVNSAVIHINNLGNRVAHHEPLFTPTVHLQTRLDEIEFLLGNLDNPVGRWVIDTSTCRSELMRCPLQI